jgi:2'-5' RNA ligase
MRCVLHCLLSGPFLDYHAALVREIADRFDLPFTREQALAPHFTLKYDFEVEDAAVLEEFLAAYCEGHAPAPVEVGGFAAFPPDVAFLRVELSPEARAHYSDLVRELRALPWVEWGPFDGDRLRPHSTLAERCGEKLGEVLRFLEGREQRFLCSLDNVSVMRYAGTVAGIRRWELHRRFPLAPPRG